MMLEELEVDVGINKIQVSRKVSELSFLMSLPNAKNVINVLFPKYGSRMNGRKSFLFPVVYETAGAYFLPMAMPLI